MPNIIHVYKWQKFFRWTIIWDPYYSSKDRTRFVQCKCECWTIRDVRITELNKWRSKSCWCIQREKVSEIAKKNFTKTWLWIWHNRFTRIYQWMKCRCENKNTPNYIEYWWRWIKCMWNSLQEFYNDMHESYIQHVKIYWESNTSLDRIDNNWNYCKENCKRYTRREQANNTRRNVFYEYKWKKYTLRQLSDLSWIKKDTLRLRIITRRDIERAVEEPLHRNNED